MIKWDSNSIKNWLNENRHDVEFIDTKVIGRTRKVYIRYKEDSGWVNWSSLQKQFVPSFKQKYTTDTFKEALKYKFDHIKLIGDYIGWNEYHTFYCNECNLKFEKIPKHLFINKYGCGNCHLRIFKNDLETRQSDFKIKFIEKFNNEYSILGEYKNLETPILFKHNICGREFEANPSTILRGLGCPYCRIEKMRKTHDEFKKELDNNFPDKYELLTEYEKRDKKIKVKYLCCETIKYTNPADLLNGKGCGVCSSSSLEKEFKNILIENNIKFEIQKSFEDCVYINKLKFDFYLLDYNILVEIQGGQHYFPVKYFGGFEYFMKNKFRDLTKKDYCKKQNIPLIEIPYWSVNKKDILKILKEYDVL